MIDRYELLLDGASSIYGSNAIAGVGNVILRNDFDGIEVSTFLDHALHSQTSDTNLSVTWGKNFDRGFVGGAFAYALNAEVSADEAPFTNGCNRHFEVDEHGNLRHDDLYYAEVLGMRWDECGGIYSQGAFLASMVQVNAPGSVIYRTEGTTNGGWTNFSESHVFLGGRRIPVDTDGDGVADVSFRDYDTNGREGFRTIYPRFERKHLMAYQWHSFSGFCHSVKDSVLGLGYPLIFYSVSELPVLPCFAATFRPVFGIAAHRTYPDGAVADTGRSRRPYEPRFPGGRMPAAVAGSRWWPPPPQVRACNASASAACRRSAAPRSHDPRHGWRTAGSW